MSKPTPVPRLATGDAVVDAFGRAVKASIERITGQQDNSATLQPLAELPGTAVLADVIAAHNALVAAFNILVERLGQ